MKDWLPEKKIFPRKREAHHFQNREDLERFCNELGFKLKPSQKEGKAQAGAASQDAAESE